jgi:hypothetical protein
MNKLLVIVLILLSLFAIFFQEKICNTLSLSPLQSNSTIKEGLDGKPYTFISGSHPKEYQNLDFYWCTSTGDNPPTYTQLTAEYVLFYTGGNQSYLLDINSVTTDSEYITYLIACGGGGGGAGGGPGALGTGVCGGGGGGGGIMYVSIDNINTRATIDVGRMSSTDEGSYPSMFKTDDTVLWANGGGNGNGSRYNIAGRYGNYYSTNFTAGSSGGGGSSYVKTNNGADDWSHGGASYHRWDIRPKNDDEITKLKLNVKGGDAFTDGGGGGGFFTAGGDGKNLGGNGGDGYYLFDAPEIGPITLGCGGGGGGLHINGQGGGPPGNTDVKKQCGGAGGYPGKDGRFGGGGGGGSGSTMNSTKGGLGGSGCVFIAFVTRPKPCVYPDAWTDESPCPPCGSADVTKKQTKTATSKRCLGEQTLSQTVSCNLKPCCVYGAWTDDKDTPCPSCGTNVHKKQHRTATTKDCFGAQTETKDGVPCDIPECVPCVYNAWTDDDKHCPSCGTDISITQHRTATTKDCLNEQTQHRTFKCEIPACPPCEYTWADTTSCTKPCNGGTKTITGTLTNSYGQECAKTQTKENVACNIEACPPCSYGSIDTSTLSACSLECGGGKQTGTLLITNKNGNDNCQTKTDSQSCNTQGCPNISKIIPYQYEEYRNLYLSNQYNSASNFTIAQSFAPQNSSFKDNFYRINSQTAEQYRNKLLVSTYALTIDMMGISLPYATYYYFNNSQSGVLQITNGSTVVTTLQLNNNNNNFGTILNAIYINSNGVPRIYNSRMYFLDSDIDTTKYSIYLVTSKIPHILKAKQILSCIVPGVGKKSTCMITLPGQNMAVAFTINLKSANNTANKQQIIGITMDQSGDEQIVFGAWVCSQSNTLIIQRATVSNPQNVISNCKVSLDVGLDNSIYILFNGNTNLYEIYKNGVLEDTNIPDEAPKYTSGTCYIYSSFKSYGVVSGTISNVVYLASDYKTFATDDLDRAINYMNNSIDYSSMEKPLQEGFSNVYYPLPDGSYATQDLRNMESELIQELNEFNKQYSYYKKYMYNNRHQVTGDTTQPFLKDNNSTIGPADFPDLKLNVPLNEIQIYKNLLSDLHSFNHALDVSVNLSTTSGQTGDIAGMNETQNKVVQLRKQLDANLFELNEVEGSMATDSMRSMYSTLFANILWTSIATSMVYLVFVHT